MSNNSKIHWSLFSDFCFHLLHLGKIFFNTNPKEEIRLDWSLSKNEVIIHFTRNASEEDALYISHSHFYQFLYERQKGRKHKELKGTFSLYKMSSEPFPYLNITLGLEPFILVIYYNLVQMHVYVFQVRIKCNVKVHSNNLGTFKMRLKRVPLTFIPVLLASLQDS